MSYFLALLGMGLMVGVAGVGSAVGLVIAGSSVLGTVKKKPEAFGSSMLLSALPASQGLYGFVGFILYQGLVNPGITLFQGAVVFGAGVAMALSCGVSAIYQGILCAHGITGIGQGHDTFGKTMILAAFPELYAILSLVAAVLLQNLLKL